MLTIQGAIQILPSGASVEPGTISMGEEKQKAVILTFISDSGPLQVILPTSSVDSLLENVKKAKDKSENESTDLYIPQGGMAEAKELGKQAERIQSIKDGAK